MSRASSMPPISLSKDSHEGLDSVKMLDFSKNQSQIVLSEEPLIAEDSEETEFKSEATLSEGNQAEKYFKGFVELVSGDTFGIVGFMDDTRQTRKLAV
jgi:hypothetical protein